VAEWIFQVLPVGYRSCRGGLADPFSVGWKQERVVHIMRREDLLRFCSRCGWYFQKMSRYVDMIAHQLTFGAFVVHDDS
jgi:hypothetical protein